MKNAHFLYAVSLVLVGLVITGCDKKEEQAAQAGAQQQMPPAVVSVNTVQPQTVPLIEEFAGRTSAYQKADVRPQVTGVVDKILYQQGSMVKQGQPLYKINPENYQSSQGANQAAVQQAKANVITAQASYNNAVASKDAQAAQLEQARTDVERLRPLVRMKAISEQQYEQAMTKYKTAQAAYSSAQAAVDQAQANIQSAKAAVDTAQAQLSSSQLNLDRTIVRAPISGKTDRSAVTVGALVNANQAQPLVTISKLDPIYVDISLSSSDLLRIKQQQASGAIQPGSNQVELVLENGTTYPVTGQLSLAEANVDENTGSVTWRATFDNGNYVLLPGMYVKARMVQGLINNAFLIPQSALTRSPKSETLVYIVGAEDKIRARPVTVDGTYQGNWIVTSGLERGDSVVFVGGSKVKPEQQVMTQPYQGSSSTESQMPNPSASAQTKAANPNAAVTEPDDGGNNTAQADTSQ